MEQQYTLIIGGLIIPLFLLTMKEIFTWLKDKNLQTTDNKIHKMKDDIESVKIKIERMAKCAFVVGSIWVPSWLYACNSTRSRT